MQKTRKEQEAAFAGALTRKLAGEDAFFNGVEAPNQHAKSSSFICKSYQGLGCNCYLKFTNADDNTPGAKVFKQDSRKFDKSARAFCPDLPDEMIVQRS